MIREENVGEDGEVSLVTLDRPERKNALEPEQWAALARVIREAAGHGARAIVVTGAGTAFCAGADLTEIPTQETAGRVEEAFTAVREAPVPVIAHINGAAVGAGAQLAVSCDLRVVGPHGRFRIPAAAISLPVHPGTIRRLVALAGMGTARAMLLGGDWIDAARAHTLGLAERVGELDEAIAWASEISGYAPLLLRYFKEQLQLPNPTQPDGYEEALRSILNSEDFAESMRARSDHRVPRYLGR